MQTSTVSEQVTCTRERAKRACTGWPDSEQQSVQRWWARTPAAAFEEEQEEVEVPTRGASARPGLEPGSRRHEGNCIAPTAVAAARCLSEEDVISSSRHVQLGGDKGGRAAGQSRAGSSCEAAAMCSHCADWHDGAFSTCRRGWRAERQSRRRRREERGLWSEGRVEASWASSVWPHLAPRGA